MTAQGWLPVRRGKAPSPPPLWFLLCFYNLWLEAVQHSILSSVAVAVLQKGSWNNCVFCRGCLNCRNKLLTPLTPHPQHTHAPTPPPTTSRDNSQRECCLYETLRSMRFTLAIIILQGITHTDSTEWNPLGHLGPPGLLQFLALFLYLIDIGWCLGKIPAASQWGQPWITV